MGFVRKGRTAILQDDHAKVGVGRMSRGGLDDKFGATPLRRPCRFPGSATCSRELFQKKDSCAAFESRALLPRA